MRPLGGDRLWVVSLLLAAGMVLLPGLPAFAAVPAVDSVKARQEAKHLDELPPVVPHGKAHLDHSGRKQKGKVSWYGPRFAHKRMANGERMNPHSNVAASKTLPLGSTAKVVNLKNGKAATVKIEDRGPFVNGRVVDVSPQVAKELDLKKHGVAPAEVKPITVPQPDGDIKLGAGAADLAPEKIEQAARVTRSLTGHETETAAR